MTLAVGSFESYSECFDRIQLAYNAIEKGQADRAVAFLSTIQKDAKTLQRHSKIYYTGLRHLEAKQKLQLEKLTEEVNESYQREQYFKKQERELEIKKKVLAKTKESEEKSYRQAERQRRDARDERDRAQEKIDHLKKWWWVPGYNLVLAIEELVEDNTTKARDAERDMDYYSNKARSAEKEINRITCDIKKVRVKKSTAFVYSFSSIHLFVCFVCLFCLFVCFCLFGWLVGLIHNSFVFHAGKG